MAFIAVAAYFLVMEHKAHLSGLLYYLPFLLLLACPLMHVFMHRGHGNHGGGKHKHDSEEKETRNERFHVGLWPLAPLPFGGARR